MSEITVMSYDYHKGTEEDLIFKRVAELLQERLPQAVGEYGCDLHSFIFDEVKSFAWYGEAEKACESVGVFSAIRLVQAYEKRSMGEFTTEIEPTQIAGMLVYIYGEYLLSRCDYLYEVANKKLTESDLVVINEQLTMWAEDNLPTPTRRYERPLDGLVWDYWDTY